MTAAYPPPPSVPGGASLLSLTGWATRAREVLSGVLAGRLNVTGELVIENTGFTVLTDPRLSPQSVLHMDALTAAAAGFAWHALPADRGAGEWTIRHGSGAGRVVRYAILG